MSGFQNQRVTGYHLKHLLYFRQKLPAARDRNKWPRMLRVAHLRFRVERAHPYEAARSSRHLCHMFDGVRIHSSHSEVQRNPAEYLYFRNGFARQTSKRRRRLIVILDDNAAHSALFCQTREIDCIDGPGKTVRTTMTVNID